MTFDKSRLKEIVGKFSGCKVAVLGDLICDRFIYGDVERISPEAPVPVVRVSSEELQVGGAANVVHNIITLKAHAHVFGVVGDDEFGRFLRRRLSELGADVSAVFTDTNRITTLKTRIMSQSQHLLRIDREITEAIPEEIQQKLYEALEQAKEYTQALIISDYAKGVLSASLAERAIRLFRDAKKPVICDPKPANITLFKGVNLLTPNKEEALKTAGINRLEDDSIYCAATKIKELAEAEAVAITAGGDGIYLLTDDEFVHLPAVKVEVYDVVGAGDTVCAVVGLSIACGASLREAVALANVAGGIVVGKLGLATVKFEELIAKLE